MRELFDRFRRAVEEEFPKKNILVVGDLMVDEYITGRVTRISPEAPVPVLNFQEKRLEAGGASNVANNVAALGAKVSLAGMADEDAAGSWLRRYLASHGIETEGVIREEGRSTIVKTRFATKGQQLLRVDNERTDSIHLHTQEAILRLIEHQQERLHAVILSDYQKGVLADAAFVRELIRLCRAQGILISIDSKSRSIGAFEHADFVKPNNLELENAVGIRISDDESLERAGRAYLADSGAEALVVTRGARGVSLFRQGQARQDFPAVEVQVFDVTGAGDTVISTITLGLTSGLTLEESITLANLAAGRVISAVGTVPIERDALLRSIRQAALEQEAEA